MTGRELIEAIIKNNLEDNEIIPYNLFNPNIGDYLRFETTKPGVDYEVLWLTDDYWQDVIAIHAGEKTYGKFNKKEAEIFVPSSRRE